MQDTIKNYHEESVEYEKKFEDLLLPFYFILIEDLNKIEHLTIEMIDAVVSAWKILHHSKLQSINREYLDSLERLSMNIVEEYSKTDEMTTEEIKIVDKKKSEKLVDSNMQLLNLTTEFVKQKFIELSILEKTYDYNDELSTEFVNAIASSTLNKLETFSTQSTIQNLRLLISTDMALQGYTEYYWHTQRDSRVRPTHAANDGKWFSLFTPPPVTGHPGHDYNCRCWMSKFR